MGNSIGLGGISLVIAAVVWLLIFVPGYANRSQLKASEQMVRTEAKVAKRSTPISADQRLRRLLNTQRGFSVLFGLGFLAAIATALAAATDGFWWVAFSVITPVTVLALFVQRAAGQQRERDVAAHHHHTAVEHGAFHAEHAVGHPTTQDRGQIDEPAVGADDSGGGGLGQRQAAVGQRVVEVVAEDGEHPVEREALPQRAVPQLGLGAALAWGLTDVSAALAGRRYGSLRVVVSTQVVGVSVGIARMST